MGTLLTADLSTDGVEGSEMSSPFVAFSSSTVMRQKSVTNIASLGLGALLNPFRDSVVTPPICPLPPLRCSYCGAYANLYSPVTPPSSEWHCVFCGRDNVCPRGELPYSPEEEEVKDLEANPAGTFSQRPELLKRVVDYRKAAKLFSTSTDAALGAPLVFVIDERISHESLTVLKTFILQALESLSESTRVGLITFGTSVSVYDLRLSSASASVADVLPCRSLKVPNPSSNHLLIYGQGLYLAPLAQCLSTITSVIHSLTTMAGTSRRETMDAAATGVEVALALVRGPAKDLPREPMKKMGGCSRILVCLEGHTKASLPKAEMGKLGREGKRLGTQVDLFWVRGTNLGSADELPWLDGVLELAKESGGVVVDGVNWEEAGTSMLGAVCRSVGVKGRVEVRTGAGVKVDWVVGPARAVTGRGGGVETVFQGDKGLALELDTVEEGLGLGLGFRQVQNVANGEDWVYFQFAVSFIGLDQTEVVRVVTARLAVTDDRLLYLESVDDEVAAVLAAKKCAVAVDSLTDGSAARKMVEARVQDIAQKFGRKVPRSRMTQFPNQLPRLPELLYHLQGSAVVSNGDRVSRQLLFALLGRSDLDLSLRLLSPQVLVLVPSGMSLGLQEVPPYTLALHSDRAVILDKGTRGTLWLGSELCKDLKRSAQAEKMCLAAMKDLTHSRFPVPVFHIAKEGSREAWMAEMCLVPAHKDSVSDQETRFPFLRELSPEERVQLRSKLLPGRELSFCEWMKSLNVVPPDPIPLK